jgi:hypothetical protein
MTTLSTELGEIYFIGERDTRSGERSPYVKIGLVGSTRTSADRLYDHRTSNPRELIVHAIVKTDLVAWTENALHKKFGKQRIRGEWFVLDDELLTSAIAEAHGLVTTLAPLAGVILQAEALHELESDGTTIPATEETLTWLAALRAARCRVKTCSDLDKLYAAVVRELTQSGEAGPEVGETKVVDRKEFDEAKFKESHPDEWAAYTTIVDKGISARFTPSRGETVAVADVDPDLAVFAESFREGCADAEKSRRIVDELKSKFVELRWLDKSASLDLLTAEVHIQAACGTAEAITGVCTWKRIRKLDPVLDKAHLAEADPELYERFCIVKQVLRTTKDAKGQRERAAATEVAE